jgi:hypothetical protein
MFGPLSPYLHELIRPRRNPDAVGPLLSSARLAFEFNLDEDSVLACDVGY